MTMPTIFDVCTPRPDVLDGTFSDADFAADLAAVLRGDGPPEYRNAAAFFARTYPTEGLKVLLRSVCGRLSGRGASVAPIFRLDTNYGGGKTHALIALAHAAQGLQSVPDVAEFVDPALLPQGEVRVAAFDGENADPNNGRPLGAGLRAFTPWGELAFALAGPAGYERVRRSDEARAAPGAETIRELFAGRPTLILLDELSIYLRKLKPADRERSDGQMTAFLTGLFKAVETSSNAAVVYTLAVGKGGKATDAYRSENQFIADAMDEAESVSARKATLLDPTEEDETVKVLCRRLFERVDGARAATVVEAYRELWDRHRPLLPQVGARDLRTTAFAAGYPFHPDLIDTLRNKTSTLGNFQRVRGMLRLLGRTVGRLWAQRPAGTHAIHVHHVDPGFDPVRQEIITRLGQRQFLPALRSDVAAAEGETPSAAEQMDASFYAGLAPYGSHVARTVFVHTLAFNDALKGASREQVRHAILSPSTEISFIDDAITRLQQGSAFLDDRPNVPLRFQAEANLRLLIRRQEEQVDPAEARGHLNDRIREIYKGSGTFNPVAFGTGPFDVPDDTGDGRPYLVIVNHDAADVPADRVTVPELVSRIYQERGSAGDRRLNRNNLAFLLADAGRKANMKAQMVRHLALRDLLRPERMQELADYQQVKMREEAKRSEQEVALAIQQCYRHVLYPTKARVDGAAVDLGHAAIEVHTASQTPGDGQKHVVQVLRDSHKLRLPDDHPDSPSYIRDRTPLKKGEITTADLRAEFRRDPALPMLVGDDVFLRGIRQGVEGGDYVYRSGDLVWARGQPMASLAIDENSFVLTAEYARNQGIWPKPEPVRPAAGAAAGQAETAGAPGGGVSTIAPVAGANDTRQGGFAPGAGIETSREVSAEGPLKEALTSVWEKARGRKFSSVATLQLALYDAVDGFRVLALAGGVAGASKQVAIEGGYETTDGGSLQMEFSGPIGDAAPVKDFLEPQLRAARDKTMKVRVTLTFAAGLDLSGGEPEKLTERLGKFGSGTAWVQAVAAGEDA